MVATQSALFAQPANPGGAHSETNPIANILIVLALIITTSLFVLAETAMLTVRRTRIEQLVEEGNRSARLVAQLLSEPTRMLATLQVGLTLVQLLSAGAAAESAVEPFSAYLRTAFATSAPFISSYAHSISFGVVMLTVAFLQLVIGEITPKSIAIQHAERIALVAAWPIRRFQSIATVLVSLVTVCSRVLVKPFGGMVSFSASGLSEEALRIMVEQSEEHGVIEAEEREMIHSIFEFADTVVRKVMTPRLDVTGVEAQADTDALIRVVTESGHSRLPVFDGDLDNIVGIVHVKDVLRCISGPKADRTTTVTELMRPPYFIPETKPVDDLLREMKRSKSQIAIVRDEYGTTAGIITIEDLLEEIVGDIQDEYDHEIEPAFKQIDDHTCIVDGRMSIEDFNDRMGSELPVEESDTLGGYVFGLVGHQPIQGETAEWDGFEFGVEVTDGRRIQKVRVTRAMPLTHEADDGDDDNTGADN